jgi:nitrogen fixation protein NifU and related proteins
VDLAEAREVLIDHARHPRNCGSVTGALQGECRNPLCGDLVRVFVTVQEARIAHCTLEVQGCTICTASASIMSEQVRGLRVAEAQDLRQSFADILMTSSDVEWPSSLVEFRAFSHLRVNPARIPCALIPWYALKEALGC